MIHIPTLTTLHIDASGHEETHTIMRAELVAIYVALDRLNALVDFSLFTDSLSSLQAIRKRLYHPDPEAYHHHQVLIDKIASLIMEREHSGRTTTLRKVRAHTNVMGNELADEAAKLSVRQFDELPEAMKISVTLGAVAPRPPFWMGNVHPLPCYSTGRGGCGTAHNDTEDPMVDRPGGGTSTHESFHPPF